MATKVAHPNLKADMGKTYAPIEIHVRWWRFASQHCHSSKTPAPISTFNIRFSGFIYYSI